MQNLEWYLADLKSTGKNTIETVEKSLTDMFIRLVIPVYIANIFNKLFTGVAEKHLNHADDSNHSPDMLPLKEFWKHIIRCMHCLHDTAL